MPKSTLFLQNVTCLDHAIIDQEGLIQGGSYHVNCLVTGDVIGDEAVVVDFSKIKHEIKSAIDDKEYGYDHKLILINEFSKIDKQVASMHNFGHVQIKTPFTQCLLPSNAVRMFSIPFDSTLEKTFNRELSNYLSIIISRLHPNIYIDIDITVTEDMFIPKLDENLSETITFRYTHGLKNSSSWGCQNIGHGHLSFISLHKFDDRNTIELAAAIHESYNKSGRPTVFVMKENIIDDTDETMTVAYQTSRGVFEITYIRSRYNIIVLETETTIENIVEWFCKYHNMMLNAAQISKVFISEGLSKGSCKTIEN